MSTASCWSYGPHLVEVFSKNNLIKNLFLSTNRCSNKLSRFPRYPCGTYYLKTILINRPSLFLQEKTIQNGADFFKFHSKVFLSPRTNRYFPAETRIFGFYRSIRTACHGIGCGQLFLAWTVYNSQLTDPFEQKHVKIFLFWILTQYFDSAQLLVAYDLLFIQRIKRFL
jgi:hypothetical protein